MAQTVKRVTLASEASCEMTEKKSVFIGHAKPIASEEEALEFIAEKRHRYADATHNVYAYSLENGLRARYSDDGEPQGTAGIPVLDVIRKSGFDDAVIVVTRYFGGILLGAGGLVRAYSAAAKLAVEKAGIAVYESYDEIEIACGYQDYQKIKNEFAPFGIIIDDSVFADKVFLKIAVKKDITGKFLAKITEMTAARAVMQTVGERFDKCPVEGSTF